MLIPPMTHRSAVVFYAEAYSSGRSSLSFREPGSNPDEEFLTGGKLNIGRETCFWLLGTTLPDHIALLRDDAHIVVENSGNILPTELDAARRDGGTLPGIK
jgi:hypothetical protein